ncbi:MAG: tRNA lysidine(34) synthetase TilS [Bacillota bacterium]|nr:tRNA lysidine(34) synthetase TilS [Bacillota bacterium]
MDARSTVLKTIEEHKLIQSGDALVLGLSGGPDSICLLHILAGLQQELNFKLYALHVNHQIRGKEADEDMRYAISVCKELLIPITVKLANIPAISKEWGLGEEETGRKIRQKALLDRAKALKEKNEKAHVKLVLAHNKDDQAETVLMRIIRGTGVHGLGAMDYKRNDGLIRPLLDVTRTQVEEYCEANNLNPRIDSTNRSTEYTRNKIRLNLIPAIEKEYNPNFKEGLVRLANAAREDDSFIDRVAHKEIPVIKTEADWNSMPAKQLKTMDVAVAKRVIKMMFARVGLKQDIAAIHVQNLLGALNSKNPVTIEFPKNYKALVKGGIVYFKTPQEKVEVRKDYKVYCSVVPVEELPPLSSFKNQGCALDAEKVLDLNCDIVSRTRRSQDFIKPLGLGGTKKLTDYMKDNKIPAEKREAIRLLCAEHQILWVEGYTVSETCKVDGDTRYALVVMIQED